MADNATNPMKSLYKRLSDLGLSRKYLQQTVLPSWWSDEVAVNPAGFAEAVMLLSRHLGLDVDTLRSSGEIRLAGERSVKLQKPANSSGDDLAVARRLAVQVGRLPLLGLPEPGSKLPSSGGDVRQQILDQDHPWVSLETLLDYCWSAGVPVIHVSAFPKNTKRMHGLAARVAGRPVIVISKEVQQPAWLLFILAHELGHIALGHVDEDAVLVDEVVDEDSLDEEERQANAFALELLSGDPDTRFKAADRWPKATGLAQEALRIGRQQRIDPGHVVLNYAHSMGKGFFPVANAALKILDPNPDGVGLIRKKMAATLDWSSLPVEAAEFIARMTQTEVAAAA